MIVQLTERLDLLESKIETLSLPPRALTLELAARLLSRSPMDVLQMIGTGELRAKIIGGMQMIPMSEVVRLTSLGEPPPPAPRGPAPRLD